MGESKAAVVRYDFEGVFNDFGRFTSTGRKTSAVESILDNANFLATLYVDTDATCSRGTATSCINWDNAILFSDITYGANRVQASNGVLYRSLRYDEGFYGGSRLIPSPLEDEAEEMRGNSIFMSGGTELVGPVMV